MLRNGKIHSGHSKQYSSPVGYSSEFEFNSKWNEKPLNGFTLKISSYVHKNDVNLVILLLSPFYNVETGPRNDKNNLLRFIELVRVKLGFDFKKLDSRVYLNLKTMLYRLNKYTVICTVTWITAPVLLNQEEGERLKIRSLTI